jgi:hypothetical protein
VKRKRFSVEQIVAALKQAELGDARCGANSSDGVLNSGNWVVPNRGNRALAGSKRHSRLARLGPSAPLRGIKAIWRLFG